MHVQLGNTMVARVNIVKLDTLRIVQSVIMLESVARVQQVNHPRMESASDVPQGNSNMNTRASIADPVHTKVGQEESNV